MRKDGITISFIPTQPPLDYLTIYFEVRITSGTCDGHGSGFTRLLKDLRKGLSGLLQGGYSTGRKLGKLNILLLKFVL